MKIAYIGISNFPPEIGKTDIKRVSEIASKNLENEVFLFVKKKNKEDSSFEKIGRLFVHRFSYAFRNDLVNDFLFSLKLIYFFIKKQYKFDIIHIYNPFIFSFIFQAYIKLTFSKSKIVYDIRTGPLKTGRRKTINYFFISLAHYFSSATIIINKNLVGNFLFVGKSIPMYEISLGFDPISYDDNFNSKKNHKGKVFIYIGSMYPRRSCDVMLECFVKYFEVYPDDTLNLLGGGDENYVRDLKLKYESKNIKFLGSVPQEEVVNFIKNSDYGVAYIPMTDYFMYQPPLKTIEYLGCGLPVIGTATEGNKFFINGKNGLCGNENDFVDVLCEFREIYSVYDKDLIIKSVDGFKWESLYLRIYNEVYGLK